MYYNPWLNNGFAGIGTLNYFLVKTACFIIHSPLAYCWIQKTFEANNMGINLDAIRYSLYLQLPETKSALSSKTSMFPCQ